MRFIPLLFAFTVTIAGCPKPLPDGPAVVEAVIDCTTTEAAPQVSALLTELSPLVQLASPDWVAVYFKAKAAGKVIGGCALAALVQGFLGNRMTPPTLDNGNNAKSTLDRFRAEEAGGASFLSDVDGRKVKL